MKFIKLRELFYQINNRNVQLEFVSCHIRKNRQNASDIVVKDKTLPVMKMIIIELKVDFKYNNKRGLFI